MRTCANSSTGTPRNARFLAQQKEKLLYENEQLRKELAKERSQANSWKEYVTEEISATDDLREKVRVLEVTLQSIKMGILERLEKQADLYASSIFQANVDTDDTERSPSIANSLLSDVEVGESCFGKYDWSREEFRPMEDNAGSVEKLPKKMEETLETASRLVTFAPPQDRESNLIDINEIEVFRPPNKEVHFADQETSQEPPKVSRLDIQRPISEMCNRGTRTDTLMQILAITQERKTYAVASAIEIRGIPDTFSYSELSGLVRGGKIYKMKIRNNIRGESPTSALVVFAHARDAIWKVIRPSENMMKAIDAGATRVLVFEDPPSRSWASVKTKKGFMEILRRKLVETLKFSLPVEYMFEIESVERKEFNGRSEITVIFPSLAQAVAVKKRFAVEGWRVRFGADLCEGPIKELETRKGPYSHISSKFIKGYY
ncbi:hypothetical protein RUND412_000009 [Rhizina undulata]